MKNIRIMIFIICYTKNNTKVAKINEKYCKNISNQSNYSEKYMIAGRKVISINKNNFVIKGKFIRFAQISIFYPRTRTFCYIKERM